MMTAERTAIAADMAWALQLVAESPKLRATTFEFYTLDGQLWVQVQGAQWEAHAWQVATMGRILSSYVSNGVRRQMIIGERVNVEVIDDPTKRGV